MDQAARDFDGALLPALACWGIDPSAHQLELLRLHHQTVVEVNRSINLTRIVEPVDAAVKHYADSLAILHLLKSQPREVVSVLDIGTGAGFPAFPLAVMKPEWRVTAIDGTGKKVSFLDRVVKKCGLNNLEAVHAHSSHWSAGARFDLVVMRAVAALNECVTLAGPFIAKTGLMVAYKTADVDDQQVRTASTAAVKLGLKHRDGFPYQLRIKDAHIERVLYCYER